MESLQHTKQRIRSVTSISQITKAMELVAATKMRRSQEIAIASRSYALTALRFLANLSRAIGPELIQHTPLLQRRKVKSTAIVLVTSDKGLAGAFNASVIRSFEKFMRREGASITKENDHFIAVGQKAASYLEKNFKLCDKFIHFGDYTAVDEIKPLADHIVKGYLNHEWDRVIIFSMHFRSALRQEVLQRQLFPIDLHAIRKTARDIIPETGRYAELLKETVSGFLDENVHEIREDEYLIEPSPEVVLQELIPHLVTMEIYHIILEANASEHAARRLAMKNASDNAGELIDDLTLVYNKSRQAAITKELTELTAGAEALK